MTNVSFIISQTRSGSTMLQRMLGAHTSCLTSTGEPYLMLALLQGFRGRCEDETARWAKDASDKFLDEFSTESTLLSGIRNTAEEVYDQALIRASMLCESFNYPRKTRFIDKTPRYFLILDDLRRMFSPKDFVFLVRNPLDVLASTLVFDKVGHWTLLDHVHDKFDLEAPLVDKQVDVLHGPQEIARAIRELGDKACVVRYEDLVTDTNAKLVEVCAHLGLPFEEGMLHYDATSGKYADDNSMVKHNEAVPNYINNWRDRMDSTQAKSYLQALGKDVLTTFGYPELIEAFNL